MSKRDWLLIILVSMMIIIGMYLYMNRSIYGNEMIIIGNVKG